MTADKETPVEELIEAHHEAMKERVRGQLKKLCLALIVSSLKIVREKSDKPIILLIDDLRSELDEKSQQSVYRQLMDIDLQLFISNIEEQIPGVFEGKEFKMFHVEHGIIKARKIS